MLAVAAFPASDCQVLYGNVYLCTVVSHSSHRNISNLRNNANIPPTHDKIAHTHDTRTTTNTETHNDALLSDVP